MAHIRIHHNNTIQPLREHHSIGRRKNDIDTQLELIYVSKLHTSIEWKNAQWIIKDMSTNGTWVNGIRLTLHQYHPLKHGDIIDIAGEDGTRIEMLDTSPPEDMIYSTDQQFESRPLRENMLLPNEESPVIELYKCPERHQWFAQHLLDNSPFSELGPFEHDSHLQCGNQHWTFLIINDYAPTAVIEAPDRDINDIEFRFDLTQNEENTTLTLINGSDETWLNERAHHYLIVHLLRHKQKQFETSSESHGWIDCELLSGDMGIDEAHINILVFRARKQISLALMGYNGSAQLLERRRRLIRTGIENYSIYKEGQREH